MTNREFYVAVINGELNDEIVAKAHEEIAKLDKRNASRKGKSSKRTLENVAVKNAIVEYLKGVEDRKSATEIGENVGISMNKASSLCVQLRKEGVVDAEVIKNAKGNKVKGYAIVQ